MTVLKERGRALKQVIKSRLSPSAAFALLATALISLLMGGGFLNNETALSAPPLAQPSNFSDFGAETIEQETPLASPSEQPISPDLVEEKAPGEGKRNGPGTAINTGLDDNLTLGAEPAGEAPDTALDQLGRNPNKPGTKQGAVAKELQDAFQVKEAEISSLVKLISKITRRNYVVDSSVKGKVTMYLPIRPTTEEALRIFDAVLLLKGFTTVPIGQNTWKVVPAKDARQTTIPLIDKSSDKPSDVLVTQLIRLKYVQAADLQQLLGQFVSRDGLINSFPGTNSLIFIDSEANIKRLAELVHELDVPAQDQDITIIPVLHAEAKDLADKINEILGEKSDGDASHSTATAIRAPRTPGRPQQLGQNSPQAAPASSDSGDRRLPLKLIPDERTNSLILVADADMTSRVRALVEQLDSPLDLSGGRFYVYRLKHADAEELAGILTDVIGGGGSSSSERSSKKKEATSGSSISRRNQERNSNSSSRFGRYGSSNNSSSSDYLNSQSRGQLAQGAFGSALTSGKVNFEGEVSIAPDPATNSLVINASRADYMRLKQVIDELDVKRRQVIVEATILEVTLNKTDGMGIELQGALGTDSGGVVAQTNFGGLTNLLTNPAALSDLSIAAASTGTLTLPGGIVIPSQAVLLSAVSRNNNVNVLSSPTLLTTDNEEAEIIVGQNVPFVTSTSADTTNLQSVTNQIERQDVGITLRITPQISTGDFVTLKIFVEISSVVQGTQNDEKGPTTTIRTSETNVEVKDGQMIVTGGLISDSETDAQRGVPFMEDIPFFGNYFKREDHIRERTNLLIFITPKIIKDQFDLREVTVENRDTIQNKLAEDTQPEIAKRLQSTSIDNVAEDIDIGEVKPTTITPANPVSAKDLEDSQNAMERTKTRLRDLYDSESQNKQQTPQSRVAPTAASTSKQEKDIIDVTVHPKLPELAIRNADKSDPVRTNSTAERHRLASISQPNGAAEDVFGRSIVESPASDGQNIYVVLREVSTDSANGLELPFKYIDSSKTIGIVLPAGTSIVQDFFQVGGRYSYSTARGKRQFICLGRYESITKARSIHSKLSSDSAWYNLSPYETLKLGKELWTKG